MQTELRFISSARKLVWHGGAPQVCTTTMTPHFCYFSLEGYRPSPVSDMLLCLIAPAEHEKESGSPFCCIRVSIDPLAFLWNFPILQNQPPTIISSIVLTHNLHRRSIKKIQLPL